jgi:hydrogenase-4 component B
MIVSALVCWALAGLVSVLGPLSRRAGSAANDVSGTVAWLLCALGSLLGVVAGARALAGDDASVSLGDLGGGLGAAHLRLDSLAGLFAVITFGVALPACLASSRPTGVGGRRPRLPGAVALGLGSVMVVLGADHLFVFLFGWESLTLAFFLLAGFERRTTGADRAAVLAAVFGKASGTALLVGGLLAAAGGGLSFDDLASVPGRSGTALALLLLGFGIKVGVVPVQIWLPTTYATAPAGARAVMAGATVNVGFYGMWRSLELLGPAPAWLAVVVLLVAGVTAVLGIAHAAVHPDLRGLIAWSSVENAGLICAGFGVALVGSSAGNQRLMAVGLLAATAQVIAHALGKSLLFVAAGQIERLRGTTDLEMLRGVAHECPWAGTGLVVGAMTLAGLPLTAGFASEWLTLESFMQQFRIDHLGMQLASATAGALVALTVGVAGVTFVRLVALTAFSAGSHPSVRKAESWAFRAGTLMLVTGCLGVAMAAPWEVRVIAAGLRPLVGTTTDSAHVSPFVLQPVFAGFSSLSPSWLWLVLPSLTLVAALVAGLLSGGRLWRVRRVPAWSSASPGTDRGVGYTSFGYANPMRKVLSNILLTRHQLLEVERAERSEAARLTAAAGPGADEQGRDTGDDDTTDRTYRIDVVEVVERYLYQPAYRVLRRTARGVTRLQSGRLDAYMTYMLVTLLAVIALVAALS